MAQGKRCPFCKGKRTVLKEDKWPRGSWVVYYCEPYDFKEKVFEGDEPLP